MPCASRRAPRTASPAAGAPADLARPRVVAAFIFEGLAAGLGNTLTLKEAVIAAHVYLTGACFGEDVLVELLEEAPASVQRRLNRLHKLDWIVLQTDAAIPDRLLVATSPHGAAIVERWIRHV